MLHIGKSLSLPLEAATETFALIGRRGSGKTNAACVLVEELLRSHVQVVIIEPVGVWYGLKSDKSGNSAGFPITVLGGEHADLPLNEASGVVVADFVVEHQISCVLDTSLFSKSAQRRFVADFCERLYRRKAEDKYKTPLHLVIEEADCFAPQRLFAGDERMFGSVDALVRRGRSRGVGVTLISQRPQVINKDVLSQVEVLACLQINSPQDRKAVDAWVEAHDIKGVRKEFMESLAGLERGEAWFWSPGLLDIFKRVHVRARSTFDSSATPKVGEKRVEPKHLAKVDIEKLRAALSATIKQAEDDDPRKLRQKITELERQVKAKGSVSAFGAIGQEATSKARAAGFKDGYAKGIDSAKKLVVSVQRVVKAMRDGADLLTLGADAVAAKAIDKDLTPREAEKAYAAAKPVPLSPGRIGEIVDYATSMNGAPRIGGMNRMLVALAQHQEGCSRARLAIFAGLSPNSGSFSTYLSRLKAHGWIVSENHFHRITTLGLKELGDYEPLPTGDALFNYWLREVGENGGEGRILKALRGDACPPDGYLREQLAHATLLSANSGSFSTYLSRLRTRGLITTGNPIKLAEELRG